ncbi:hypothetical protein LXA43DRAFT_294750 [Ganoderma leucocontextum]|nr:hypothetical protein LXA43DRAFT_294750 [Ganoderma leucocontextum]
MFARVEPANRETAKRAARDLKRAKQLCRAGHYERAVPRFVKALEDYDNVELVIRKAREFPDKGLAMSLLQVTEDKAQEFLKRDLGQDCFEETSFAYGEFWGVMGTRPYMRTLHAIAYVAYEMSDIDKAITTSVEMLRLCQGDNVGQRDFLPALLLRAQRYEDALSFCQIWLDPQFDGKNRPLGGCTFAPPSPEPLSQGAIAFHTNSWRAITQLLNAALASFHVYGDCEQARQYLALGSKGNRRIMSEMWVGSRQPDKPSMRPYRMSNHSDDRGDAHDYLWLHQDLWMGQDVWDWATRQPDVRESALKPCAREECLNREEETFQYKRCSGCRDEFYCSAECQRLDWPRHKLECFGYRRRLLASQAQRDEGSDSDTLVSDGDSNTVIDEEDIL